MTKETKEKNFSEKLGDKISSLNAEEKLEDLIDYSRSHVGDTVAYVALFVGIILSLFWGSAFYGHAIIGLVVGLYFSKEITYFTSEFSSLIDSQGVFRSFILAGTAFVVLIAAPMLFFGAAAAVGLRTLVLGIEGAKSRKQNDNSDSN